MQAEGGGAWQHHRTASCSRGEHSGENMSSAATLTLCITGGGGVGGEWCGGEWCGGECVWVGGWVGGGGGGGVVSEWVDGECVDGEW